MRSFYVYILECSDKSFYTGVTSNLERRIAEHDAGIDATSYTYSRRPVVLKWFEEFSSVTRAIKTNKRVE